MYICVFDASFLYLLFYVHFTIIHKSFSILFIFYYTEALELLRVAFSPHCSSPSAPLMTPLSSSWSSQMTPYLSASSRTYLFPPTHHYGQHCNSSGVVQISGHHHLSGPEVGQSHWVHCENGPTEVVLPLPAEKFQSATGAAETVLLGHHRVCSLHFNNCLVQLSYQIRHQKTTENGSDCWKDYWCSLAHPPRTVYIQCEEKVSENHSGSLTSKPSPFLTFVIWPALQSLKYQDSHAQEQFLPPDNLPYEQLNVPPIMRYKYVQLPYIYLPPHISSYSIYSTDAVYFIFLFLFIYIYMCVFLF